MVNQTADAGHAEERQNRSGADKVLLLVDSHPTTALWLDQLEDLVARLAGLGFGSVERSSVEPAELSVDALVDAIGEARLVVVASDGACPGWRSAKTARQLRELAHRRPLVLVHWLSQTHWHRTGIDPQPVRIQGAAPGLPNPGWSWTAGSRTHAEDDDVLPVPVVPASEEGLQSLHRILTAEEDGQRVAVAAAALLLPAEIPPEPDDRPVAPGARKLVNDFRAGASSPQILRLATGGAGLPLDLPLLQTLRRRLLPESNTQDLAEVLVSPLVRAGHPGGGLEWEPGVREELLASARIADIERVVRAAGEIGGSSPAVAFYAGLLQRPPLAAPEWALPEDPETWRSEAQWREARALVLKALSGPYYQQGQRELEQLSAEGGPAATSRPNPSPSTTPGPQPPRQAPMEVQQPRSRTNRTVLGDYPLRNPNFTGRVDLLADLHASLRSSNDRSRGQQYSGVTAVLPHALHGMGGVGKSLLAIEYIYQHAGDYDVVWWVPAERTTMIQQSLLMLGRRLGLDVTDEANTGVPMVLDALRQGEPYGNWLLVFDNAESPEQVMSFLPKDGPGHVLITSRDARWSQVARPLEVNVFTREESKALLRRRGPGITDEESDRLADALGDLPLAIEQAAAWHAETGMPADEYLRLLSEKQVELLDQPAPIDYQIPVIAAWNVSLDQLEARSPAALHLLNVCAFFAPEPIPRALLTRARGQEISPKLDNTLRDSIAFGSALREISRYSLARLDHRNKTVQMHRLVQAALVARMSEEEREDVRHAAHRILAANDPGEPDDADEYGTYGSLHPHVEASGAVDCDETWVRDLVINEARYLFRWGDHDAAVELASAAHRLWSLKLGEDDPQTLAVSQWLGFFFFTVGRYPEAAQLNAAAQDVFARLQAEGRGDPDGELENLTNVAIDRRASGRFSEALTLSGEVYERALQRYGPDSPETLNAAHNLAVSQRLSGLFADAFNLDQDTYERKVNQFGPDHLLTIWTRLGQLVAMRELGDYNGAQRFHEFEVARAATALGDVNPMTLLARRLLAVAQFKVGNHAAALRTCEAVSAQIRSRFGPQHPETVAAESTLAIVLRQVGHLDEAVRKGTDIVARYTERLGPDHPHTLSAKVNLAVTHRMVDDPATALVLSQEAYEGLRNRLGPDHPSTLVAATNLASDYSASDDLPTALRLGEDSLNRLRSVFGPEHPTTLACELNLAIDLRRGGHQEEAGAHQERAIVELEVLHGDAEHQAVEEARAGDIRANCDLDPMPL